MPSHITGTQLVSSSRQINSNKQRHLRHPHRDSSRPYQPRASPQNVEHVSNDVSGRSGHQRKRRTWGPELPCWATVGHLSCASAISIRSAVLWISMSTMLAWLRRLPGETGDRGEFDSACVWWRCSKVKRRCSMLSRAYSVAISSPKLMDLTALLSQS